MNIVNNDKFSTINFIDKGSVYIDDRVKLGSNITIYPNNIIEGDTEIGDNVIILPNNYILNSKIGSDTKIFNSVIENSIVKEGASIGPFSHLRPNSIISRKAKIGNFVEIKNSFIGDDSKVSHLSYVGDADVAGKVNVGCGVVFVNYNGKTKSRSVVEEGSFVGSSVNVIAPVKIGKGSYVCAGTTVDKDIEEHSFVIGRSKMIEKKGRAINYLGEDR